MLRAAKNAWVAYGVQSLDVSFWLCHRRTILSVDPWPDHMPVPAFGPRMVCHHNGRLAPRPPHGAGQHSHRHCGRQRAATAEAIGAAIAFLASEHSGYTSGSIAVIDAGLSARAQSL
jgi:Enoyl-(Acyl carrier protein) reductase